MMVEAILKDAELVKLAMASRVLGALFYYAPNEEVVEPLFDFLRQPDWVAEWPYGVPVQIEQAAKLLAQGLNQVGDETLVEVHQRLFIGPYALPAPPWGSVYLDRESVLFGDSTLALRQFQQMHQINVTLTTKEPEDHFGLLLLLTAWCAEQQPTVLPELLSQHLFPWSGRFLELFIDQAHNDFYQGLGILAQTTLTTWQQQYRIDDIKKPLFR